MNKIKFGQGNASTKGRLLLSLFPLMLLTAGCTYVEDTSDLRAFVAERSSRPVGQIEPLPDFRPYEAFVYEGSSLRNPFVPILPVVAEIPQEITDVSPDPARVKDYLEEFAVDNLLMVGTITQPGDAEALWALVTDPKGEVHRVSVGDFLGLDNGQIVMLNERRIELSEIVSNGRGGWMKRPRIIVLPE
ncbi:pilus assembly protein PilP [Nitrincola tibetensis]|nr:pilus assembly protein PilP [Nitrincola tibetensis]